MQRRSFRLILPVTSTLLAALAGCSDSSGNNQQPQQPVACGIVLPEGACVDETCTYIRLTCGDPTTTVTIAEYTNGQGAQPPGGDPNVPPPGGDPNVPPPGGDPNVPPPGGDPNVPPPGGDPNVPPPGGDPNVPPPGGDPNVPPPGGDPNVPPPGGDPNVPPPPPGPEVTPENRTCPGPENLIADFEEGSSELFRSQGRMGRFDGYGDPAGTQTLSIVDEGTDPCNKGVLHVTGEDYESYVGVSSVFQGTWDETEADYVNPVPYDAAALGYTGISFRAKQGAGQATPVRISLGTPWTEGDASGDGSCVDDPDATHPCWNRPGHYLMDDEALSNEWKTYTLCFDSDLYPTWLPFGLLTEQRRTVGTSLLNFQIQFNQAMDPASFNSGTLQEYPRSASFDFYLDDLQFVTGACSSGQVFQSSAGTTTPFGANANIGTCSPATDAAKFNAAISQAYLRWRSMYVRDDGGVVDPQEGDRVVSEAIGYGMLLTAAMGDKETFDRIWGWAENAIQQQQQSTGLLGWNNGSGGSATDGDTDMAYGLLMAEHQWPGNGYGTAGQALAAIALAQDVEGNIPRGGENYKWVFNPSYFSPAFYRAFNGWGAVIDTTYSLMGSCQSGFGGLVPDWCDPDTGTPTPPDNAQQQAVEICTDTENACLAFEGARVPLRLGHDACLGGSPTVLQTHMNALKGQSSPSVESGARIDLLRAGWQNGAPVASAVANAMAFIGPTGVGAMGLGDTVTLDAAFQATLDIIERPEFYRTYYQTTVGLMSLLLMSGNWPTL